MENKPSLYAQASAAVASKDKPTARKLLDELIFFEPGNEEAWLLLSTVVGDLNEVSDCLQHVLELNPDHAVARQKYDELLNRHPRLAELDPAKAAHYKKAQAAKKAAAKAARKAEKAKKKAEGAEKTTATKRK